jgi:hypothetical protein
MPQLVEPHSFTGLADEVKTIDCGWRFAKAWLKPEMGGPAG